MRRSQRSTAKKHGGFTYRDPLESDDGESDDDRLPDFVDVSSSSSDDDDSESENEESEPPADALDANDDEIDANQEVLCEPKVCFHLLHD